MPSFASRPTGEVPIWLCRDINNRYYWFTQTSYRTYRDYYAFYTYAYESLDKVIDGMVKQDKSIEWNGSNARFLSGFFYPQPVTIYAPLMLLYTRNDDWYFVLDMRIEDEDISIFAESESFTDDVSAMKALCHSGIKWREEPEQQMTNETVAISESDDNV